MIKEELSLYLNDKWLMASVSIVPFLLFLLAFNVFEYSTIRDIPIGIVDHEDSFKSRELIRYFDASEKLLVKDFYENETKALEALKNLDIYAFVSLDKDDSMHLKVIYNTQFILVGKAINQAFKEVANTFKSTLQIGKVLSKGSVDFQKAFGIALPIQQQMTSLYNAQFSYKKFLLSVVIPCMWQILLISTMILNLQSQRRQIGFKHWKEKGALKTIYTKLLIHQSIMFIWFLSFFLFFLSWGFKGNYSFIFLGAFLCILASQAVSFAIYFVTFDPLIALSITASYAASSLAFVGVTFPASDMSTFARVWSEFLPITHYLNIQISQINYGACLANSLKDIYYLLAFNLFFFVAMLFFRLFKR